MPIAFAALFILVAWLSGLNRYDSAYFTDEYLERYSTPGVTARALAKAPRVNDAELLAELQGLRRPRKFVTSPNMSLMVLYEITDAYHLSYNDRDGTSIVKFHLTVYYSYLYYDTRTHKHYVYHFEEVRGRWAVAPEDAYYLLRSREWLKAFMPVSLIWWVAEVVFLLGHGVFRVGELFAQSRGLEIPV